MVIPGSFEDLLQRLNVYIEFQSEYDQFYREKISDKVEINFDLII